MRVRNSTFSRWLVGVALWVWLVLPAGAQVVCPSLVASPNPSFSGEAVAVSVMGALAGSTVTFVIDGVFQPPATVTAGQPELTISTLSVGVHTITGLVNGCAPSVTLTVVAVPDVQFRQQGPALVGLDAIPPSEQGSSVALSADGNTALVGAPSDNGGAGAVFAFTRSDGQWSQQGPMLVGTGASGGAGSCQGTSVALSADGNTALVGGPCDGGSPPSSGNVGAVWIFTRSGGVWSQQGGKLVGAFAVPGLLGRSSIGTSVALSADGNTAVAGGPDDNSLGMGAVWVFTRSDGVWTQEGPKLLGSGAIGGASQGKSVALSADGNTLLVAGPGDNGSVGAVWVFTRAGGVWTQQGSKLVGAAISVALSADGNTALVGEGDGARILTRSGSAWTEQAKLVGTGEAGPGANQGASVSLSGDGKTALVGGPWDDSSPLAGNPAQSIAIGAAWAFTGSGNSWTQLGGKLVGSGGSGDMAGVQQGQSVGLSADGSTALIGGPRDNNLMGAAWVFTTLPTTVTTLSASPNPSIRGQRVTFTATVTAGATGTVAFNIDGVGYPPVAVNGGQAQIATIDLPVGTHTISASYSGDANFLGSASNTLSQTVTLKPSTISLSASPNPSVDGQAVTFTATVTAGATGAVIFSIDGAQRTPVALVSGQAQLTISDLGFGKHTVSAAFSGDANYMGSISREVTQNVTWLRRLRRLP